MSKEEKESIQFFMGKVEAELKNLTEELKSSNQTTTKLLEKHDERLGELEKWQSNMVGKITVVSVVVGAIGTGVVWLANHFFNK